jgi:hypothetical protein
MRTGSCRKPRLRSWPLSKLGLRNEIIVRMFFDGYSTGPARFPGWKMRIPIVNGSCHAASPPYGRVRELPAIAIA